VCRAMQRAARMGHDSIVSALLWKDPDTWVQPPYNETVYAALEDACMLQQSEATALALINFFSARGLAPHALGVTHDTLLGIADWGSRDVMLAYLQLGRVCGDLAGLALGRAAGRGHAQAVRVLLQFAADPTYVWRTDDDVLQPDTGNSRALRLAAQEDRSGEVVQALLDYSGPPPPQPNALDSQALRSAAKQGRTQVVDILLRHAAAAKPHAVQPSALDCQALWLAVEEGHHDVVGALLDYRGPGACVLSAEAAGRLLLAAEVAGWSEVTARVQQHLAS